MSLVNSMKYLDPDLAVRGYVEQLIEAIDFPKPDGVHDFNVDVLVEWPRNMAKAKKAAIFVEPLEIRDNRELGNGESIDGTEDQYVDDTILVNHGDVDIPFIITCWAPSASVRDILLHFIRRTVYLNPQTTAFADYFNQPITIELDSYKRIENAETAKAGLYIFEISGSGNTNDVLLEPLIRTEIQTETNLVG